MYAHVLRSYPISFILAESEGEDEQENVEEEESYFGALKQLSKKWIGAQLTHHVSATAADTFWDTAMELIPKLMSLKDRDSVDRKTPKFPQQRKKLYSNYCPPVKMRFAFKHKATGAIETVDSDATPLKRFQRNSDYVKIYEEAHVQVIKAKDVHITFRRNLNAINCMYMHG